METIFISATQGILISIGYPLLAIVGLFIAQMLLFFLIKDTMVSAIVLFILGYLSIGGYSLGSILSISVTSSTAGSPACDRGFCRNDLLHYIHWIKVKKI